MTLPLPVEFFTKKGCVGHPFHPTPLRCGPAPGCLTAPLRNEAAPVRPAAGCRCDTAGMNDNRDKYLQSQGMKAKVNRKCHVSFFFFAWTAETRSATEVLFILYFVSDPESGSEPESESISNPESESESEQPHHDSAPPVSGM